MEIRRLSFCRKPVLFNGEIMNKEKVVRKIRSRALTKDRPTKVHELRVYEPTKNDICHLSRMGHDYRFLPFDNYAVCSRCGSEILT